MSATHGRWREFGRFFLELVGFSTPRAITINLGSIVAFLAVWPTDRLGEVPVRSVWENVFHVRPYSSGMMRALSSLLHLDVEAAWRFNPLAFVVLPLLLFMVMLNGYRWHVVSNVAVADPAIEAPRA
jgi:hypothetical protein